MTCGYVDVMLQVQLWPRAKQLCLVLGRPQHVQSSKEAQHTQCLENCCVFTLKNGGQPFLNTMHHSTQKLANAVFDKPHTSPAIHVLRIQSTALALSVHHRLSIHSLNDSQNQPKEYQMIHGRCFCHHEHLTLSRLL